MLSCCLLVTFFLFLLRLILYQLGIETPEYLTKVAFKMPKYNG